MSTNTNSSVEILIKRVEEELHHATQVLERFKRGLDRDPVAALEWSDKVFACAAAAAVHSVVLTALRSIASGTSGTSLDALTRYVARKLVVCARNPERSTSPAANLLAQWTAAAWADLLDWLQAVEPEK